MLARVEDGADGQRGERERRRHRVERRHRRDRDAEGQREPLHRADPDPETCERPRADGDGEAVEVTRREAGVAEEAVHRDHQALRVGDAHVEEVVPEHAIAVHERRATGECGGLHGEHAHTPSVAIKCDNAPGGTG